MGASRGNNRRHFFLAARLVILAKMSSVWTVDNMTTVLTTASNDPELFSKTFAKNFFTEDEFVKHLASLSILVEPI